MAEVDGGVGELRSRQRVRVRVRSHRPYGLAVEIVGHEGIGASIDWLDIAGAAQGTAPARRFSARHRDRGGDQEQAGRPGAPAPVLPHGPVIPGLAGRVTGACGA